MKRTVKLAAVIAYAFLISFVAVGQDTKKKVSELQSTNTVTSSDLFMIVRPSEGVAGSKRVTFANLVSSISLPWSQITSKPSTFPPSPSVDQTITAPGTTGNRTINKAAGTVNIAAAGTSVTVTDSFVTTSSTVHCELRTNDATARIANVVPASGSFTIHLTAAATGEVSIGFLVIN